jgi:hypothetical protein
MNLAYRYGLKLADATGTALYPMLIKDPNANMQQQRFTSTINGLFNDDPAVDPHSQMPDPGMINRLDG